MEESGESVESSLARGFSHSPAIPTVAWASPLAGTALFFLCGRFAPVAAHLSQLPRLYSGENFLSICLFGELSSPCPLVLR